MSSRSLFSSWVAAALLMAILFAGLAFVPNAQASTGHWRNINPTEYTSIPNVRLNSIYLLNGGTGGIGSGNGWAVGNNGTIFHWDGFSWTNQSSGTPCNLNSVNFGSPLTIPMTPFSSSAGFIVGGNVSATTCTGQQALFWNGGSWFPITTGLLTSNGNLTSVFIDCAYGSNSGCSSTQVDAWAVGINATQGTTYHFIGTPTPAAGWTQVFVPGAFTQKGCTINSVYMVSPIEGWAAGNCGMILHYIAGGWVAAPGVPVGGFPGAVFYSIFMDSLTDGWAVGTGGKIARFTGGIWTPPVTPSASTNTFRSISMVSSSEAWVIGDSATIIHGTNLQGVPSWSALSPNQVPTLRGLRSVHATGGSNIWSDGETGTIIEYDGTVWGSISAPLQTNFNAVFMSGDSDAVAVGNKTASGPTIARWDGVKWSRPQGSVAVTDLWGVWELNSGEYWVVGTGSVVGFPHVAHSVGGSIADVTPPPCPGGTPNCVLLSVYGTASNNVWALGTGGLFAQWTGAAWGAISPTTPLPNPTTTKWRSLTFVGGDPNNGWAVGFDSTPPTAKIYCYNNACAMLGSPSLAWTTIPIPLGVPANTQLNSVSTESDNNNRVWISGSNGIILLVNGNTQTITPTFTVGTYNLTSILVDSSTDGWAVGQDTGTSLPVFLHYDGTAWTTVAISPPFTNVGRLTGMFLRSSTNGFAVGTTAGAPSASALGMMFHLDPPGGVYATTSSTPTSSSTSISTTSSSTASSSSTSSTQVTVTSPSTSTVVSTSVVTTTVVSTPATTSTTESTSSSTSSVSTPMTLPPVPGFPWESIIAGIILGMTVLAIVRQRKK